MQEPMIVVCPKCNGKLRVHPERAPSDGGSVWIKCNHPHCSHKWPWTLPARHEVRQLLFRCVVDGVAFAVLYGKAPGEQRFRIRAIDKSDSSIEDRHLLASGDRAPFSVSPLKSANWTASDFDHAGWHCPCCKNRGSDTRRFIQCGGC